VIRALLGRELRAILYSPASWLLLALFLLVQGGAFYLLLRLASHPQGPPGTLMQLFFGGTFLYWLFVVLVISVLTMGLVAGERRQGTLELLLTSPAGAWQVALAKYLSALLFYVALWLPTLLLALVAARLGGPEGMDWGQVAAGYLGTLVLGAGCIGPGLLASALVSRQPTAAALTFTLLAAWLGAGLLEPLVGHPWLAGLLRQLSLIHQLDDFSRGIVDGRPPLLHLSLALFCLVATAGVLARGRRRRRLLPGLTLLALNLVLVNVLAAGHAPRGDWTDRRVYALSERTRRILRRVDGPLRLTVLLPAAAPGRDSVLPEVRELLLRFRRLAPTIRVQVVDPGADPARADLLARRHGVGAVDLQRGVVLLQRGARVLLVRASELAVREPARGTLRLVAFRGEAVLARWGVRVQQNIVLDPEAVPGERPLTTWASPGASGQHPVARVLGRRVTVWPLARALRPEPGARPGLRATALVTSSGRGWGETDLSSLRGDRPPALQPQRGDTRGPLPVAVAASWRSTRLVVLGSERGLLNRRLGGVRVRDHNRDLVLAAAAWLAGEGPDLVAAGPSRLPRLQLSLDSRQWWLVLGVCVAGPPAISLCLGLLVWWRRRR
jgi:ABC-2 type transport system permease protein